MYESEISENFEGKEITPANTRNYLAREYGIELDKGLKKEITSSIQKHVEGEISTAVQKEAEKQAEKQIEREMEKETLKAIQKKVGIKEYKDKKKEEGVSPKVEGQQALVVEGKHKGKSGKIIAHSIKQKLVNIELEDGPRIGPLTERDVALQMPTAPKAKEGETKVGTKVDEKERPITYFATTKDKGGVKHTTYTFNRSDKKESQRNKGGVSPEVAFGDKYEVEEGYLEEFGEDYGDVWTVHKVFEVREGDGASADVTLINKATGEKLTDISLPLQDKKPTKKETTKKKSLLLNKN